MADWRGISEGISKGYAIGRSTGGKMAGLGSIIGKVADRLRQQRETGEALGVLGQTEDIKQRVKAKYAEPSPYGPEALAFEREKAGIKAQPQAIVDKQGNVIGYRPSGSVFQPQGLGFWDEETGGTILPKPSVSPAPTGRFNPLRALPGYASYGEDKRSAYNALRSKGIPEQEAKRRLGI